MLIQEGKLTTAVNIQIQDGEKYIIGKNFEQPKTSPQPTPLEALAKLITLSTIDEGLGKDYEIDYNQYDSSGIRIPQKASKIAETFFDNLPLGYRIGYTRQSINRQFIYFIRPSEARLPGNWWDKSSFYVSFTSDRDTKNKASTINIKNTDPANPYIESYMLDDEELGGIYTKVHTFFKHEELKRLRSDVYSEESESFALMKIQDKKFESNKGEYISIPQGQNAVKLLFESLKSYIPEEVFKI